MAHSLGASWSDRSVSDSEHPVKITTMVWVGFHSTDPKRQAAFKEYES